MAIKKCMEAGDYRRVITLAEQGEKQDKKLPGLVFRWQEARYEAYKRLLLKAEQKQLARELLLGGKYSYYKELESLVEGDTEILYRDIISELKKQDRRAAGEVYLQLISDKIDLPEILAYIRANPYAVETYASRLSAEYPAETQQIYAGYIYSSAAAAGNRKQYKQVCSILKRYKKVAGQARPAKPVLFRA
ncbi:hypothetical protein C2I18_01515 [Paenibacillus sp. PK3_47]|uniref:hypothetical protein n=1 Tax=Paenibacillus sp. PK3_47 TaxID=2072642 RepID=UPI00201D755B|nr:hypothetical protein [Paenibacillus sp. PK3_47]UQZ32340.1 hypothetical protein C2I18_01515 [Paenibacillus sp. PK3_47]